MGKTSNLIGRTWKAMDNVGKGTNHLIVGTGIIASNAKDLMRYYGGKSVYSCFTQLVLTRNLLVRYSIVSKYLCKCCGKVVPQMRDSELNDI